MRQTDLERFRKLIEAEIERVEKSLAEHTRAISHQDDAADDTPKAHSNHMADQGSDEFQYETVIQMARSESRYLYQLEQALRRVEDGTYGKCERCGKQIGKERLKAKLDARLCIACQEEADRERF